ncbi:MAG TPA: carbamoyltransferase C-terminal domain-containing protein [Longimicrobium sp.]|nr:carbamoyltransferase C-terminal domain-containing protein [Longimicrobium sp.]
METETDAPPCVTGAGAMIILGLNTFGENPAACLVSDGVLRAFCQEERFTRLKGSRGHFPTQAVGWCLRNERLTLGDVDRIAVSWDCTKYPWIMLRHLARMRLSLPAGRMGEGARNGGHGAAWRYLMSHTPGAFEQGIRDHLRDAGHRGPIPRIVYVPHHDAHAFQAFHQSPFDESAVLVADGSGEENTVSGYHFTRGGRRRLFHMDVPQSLGWFFGGFTAYLGFHSNRDEGKLMGLAALGTARREQNPWLSRLDEILRVGPEGFELDPTFFKFAGNEHHPSFSDRLRRFVTAHDPRLEPVAVGELTAVDGRPQPRYLLPEYVDLAYAVQDRLEQALLAVARRLRRESGSARLCLAGGVAMNCKANGHLLAEAGFGEIFVHPAASDDGAAIGAALYVALHEDRLLPNPLPHAQWGPEFTDGEVAAALEGCGVPFTAPDDVARASADLLAQGRLLGWFQGRVEMGARALGGRSIVACPNGDETRHRVNRRVKYREEWRPYCPSIAAEAASRYLRDPVDARFMILARHATPELARSTVHVDGTVRPQTVDAAVLPLWHHLLCEVGARTGHPVLLNTSFNVRGEPIVCTPHDAIRCFFGSGLDAMAIGGFLVRKPGG